MGDFDGKVVYITGIARGQGRKHAIRFAREGASVIGLDLCASPSEHVGYKSATEDDLAQTVEKVRAEGGEILAEIGDVRDLAFQQDLVARGVEQFGGRLDVVIANAGICNWGKVWEIDEQQWQDTIDINLTGYWKTLKATIPHMLAADNGGSIVLVSSVAGLKAMPVQSPYSASKYGVVGLAQTAAKELGEHRIRV
ncbi:mycofactocin-coupled SDR family oxidoreductase, partial [Dietzia natronolimnaea]